MGTSDMGSTWTLKALGVMGAILLVFIAAFIAHVSVPFHAGMPGEAAKLVEVATEKQQKSLAQLDKRLDTVQQAMAALTTEMTNLKEQMVATRLDTKELATIINNLAIRIESNQGRWNE